MLNFGKGTAINLTRVTENTPAHVINDNFRKIQAEFNHILVGPENILPEAVQHEAIAPGAVSQRQISDGAISFNKLDQEINQTISDAATSAEEAKQQAQSAFDTATQATQDATNAINQAQTAFDNAQNALTATDSLANRMMDAEGNISALQQTSDSFATRITDAENNISTFTQTVEGLQTTVTDVQGDVSALTQTADSLQSRMTTAEGNISILTQTTDSLTTQISAKADQSWVSSQISQLSDDINLRVEKDDIINQINLSTEGILIDGAKVHITGQTTIDDAVIKDAMIQSVSASKIITTSLSAISANLGNVTAGNITGVRYQSDDGIHYLIMDAGHAEIVDGTFFSIYNNYSVQFGMGDPLSPSKYLCIVMGIDTETQKGYIDSQGDSIEIRALAEFLKGIKTEAWHTVTTFQNGWSAYNASSFPVQYMKDPMGFVHLRGLVGGGTQGYSTVFILPVGYRPQYSEYFGTTQSNIDYVPRIEVTPDGNVYVVNGGTNYTSLSGITFYAGW